MSDYQKKLNQKYEKEMGKFRELVSIANSVCGNFLFLAYEDGLMVKLST